MRNSLTCLALLGISVSLLFPAHAQNVVTEAVGLAETPLLGSSDSFISLPFSRPSTFVGSVQTATGSNTTVAGNPWVTDQFVYASATQPNHYFVLLGPASGANPKEGHTYPIIGNTANTLTVDLGPDDLVGIPAGALLSIVPNWSLATAFPASDEDVSFTGTTSSAQYKTLIRVPDVSSPGTNLPYSDYFFSHNVDGTSNNIGWRLVGDNTTDRGDDALLIDGHFVVRNTNGAPTLSLVSLGGVLFQRITVPLLTSSSSAQDNPVSMLRPLDVGLNATGLKAADGSFVAGDQLLLFDNTAQGFDKIPRVYVQDPSATNGPWRLSTDPLNDRGNELIPSGTGFIVRKATGSGLPAFWANDFPVQAINAVSRLTHGPAGDFDINLPLTGTPAVECRSTGGIYKVIFTFPTAVTFSGAAVTAGVVGTATPSNVSNSEIAVDLSGVSDVQRITVTLLGVSDGTNSNDVAVRMALLAGDVTGNGAVTASDVAQTKSLSGQSVSASNFRADVNVSGGPISTSDIALVKSKSGTLLPTDATTEPDRKATLTSAAR